MWTMAKAEDEKVKQAAILLMSLSSEDAAKVLKFLQPKEVQKVGMAMAALENVDNKTIQKIYTDFIIETNNQSSIAMNKDEQIRNVLISALGEDKANTIINKILTSSNSKGLETLKWMDAKAIADIIRLEHPQIQSIIISYLEPDQAAEVLANVDDDSRLDIMMRVSNQESIQPSAFEELSKLMENQVATRKNIQTKTLGGLQCAANIINFMDKKIETELMDSLREVNDNLANRIQELMFVFDNLKSVDDRGMQTLLREVDTNTLVLAMKGTDDELKEKIFKNMSKRAALLLKDDLEAKGPVRLTEVEIAQKSILSVAKNLADSGKITLGTNNEEMV